MPQCTAKSRSRGGAQCAQKAMRGKSVCYYHGGKSKSGLANPRFTHGKYSKHLPERLLEAYAVAGDDTQLIGLRDELRVMDARLSDLLGSLGADPGRQQWARIQAAYDALRAANGDQQATDAAIWEIGEALAAGVSEAGVWTEVYNAINLRRRLVDSEARRLQRLHQMITVESAMGMISAIVHSIRTHADADTVVKITSDLSVILARKNTPAGSNS